MKANNITVLPLADGTARVEISLSDRTGLEHLSMLANTCDSFDVEIKKWREKRSKDSNSYLWLLLSKMANVLGTTKDELYINVLDRYGKCIHITTPLEAVESFKQAYRYVRLLDNVTVNGKEVAHVLCFIGSSNYNSLEMSRLLNGVVDEAKSLGIETEPQEEIDRLIGMIK